MVDFVVPTQNGQLGIEVSPGNTVVLLGANGAGKTRLGVKIETDLSRTTGVHRVGAHRSLTMNTKVPPPSYDVALRRLYYGYDQGNEDYRVGARWQSKPAISLLSDFDHVMAALYAEENRISVDHRQAHLQDEEAKPPATKLDTLKRIWHDLIPHRDLIVHDSDLRVRPRSVSEIEYDAAEMSDGERVIFYLIGQCLLARPGIIIIDEPELHINKSIISKLWDRLESSRPDCGFVYLTHDIDFAASRRAATRYAVHSFDMVNGSEIWAIDQIPAETGLPEEVVTRIVGSRQAILFVEGDGGSLDSAVYRRIYDQMTTIPLGNCDSVIHAVSTFRRHGELHRVGCAGIIDSDGRAPDEIECLESMGIYVLPVSEIENLLLLPEPFLEIAKLLQFDDSSSNTKLEAIQEIVLQRAAAEVDRFALDYTRRQIDRRMKVIGLSAKTKDELASQFGDAINELDVDTIFDTAGQQLKHAVESRDYGAVLRLFDQKGLLSEAARVLGMKGRKELEELVGRSLRADSGSHLMVALRRCLPNVGLN
jgi:energy-coupling factor transporter ATP-binding protein EcfA2